MKLDENTLVAVPMAVWLQAKKTIGRLPIEDNVELWIALNQCKPIMVGPKSEQIATPPAAPPTDPPATPAHNGVGSKSDRLGA